MRLAESRRVPMWNGPIECRLFRFDLVKGLGARRPTPSRGDEAPPAAGCADGREPGSPRGGQHGAPRLEVTSSSSGSPAAARRTAASLWTRALPLNLLNNPWATQDLEPLGTGHRPGLHAAAAPGQRAGLPMLGPQRARRTAGLPPDTVLYYRFMLGDAVSPAGRTRTPPAPDQPKDRLRLAFASCQRLGSGCLAPTRGCWKRTWT